MTLPLVKYEDLLDGILSSEVLDNLKSSDFNTVEKIKEASIGELKKIEGIGLTTAKQLKLWAQKVVKEESKSVIPDDLSFEKELTLKEKEELEAEAQKKEEEDDDDRYILRETEIDDHTKLRTRVLLTPAVCQECAFDLLAASGLPKWDDLSDLDKAKVKEAMKKHIEVQHSSLADKKIISANEMKKQTHWDPSKEDTTRP